MQKTRIQNYLLLGIAILFLTGCFGISGESVSEEMVVSGKLLYEKGNLPIPDARINVILTVPKFPVSSRAKISEIVTNTEGEFIYSTELIGSYLFQSEKIKNVGSGSIYLTIDSDKEIVIYVD